MNDPNLPVPPEPTPEPPEGAQEWLPPRPMQKSPAIKVLGGTLGVLAAATGAFLLFVAANSRELCGATRSHQLQCEERRQQIEAAAQEDAMLTAGNSPTTAPAAEIR